MQAPAIWLQAGTLLHITSRSLPFASPANISIQSAEHSNPEWKPPLTRTCNVQRAPLVFRLVVTLLVAPLLPDEALPTTCVAVFGPVSVVEAPQWI